ncbi:MAG: hypothetical protein A2014_04735 [Spirochaetes bacterium GWF1_49_6]|nr:MAG: hypothetical protein A2014_04735 [Spirochaetes bacterium GWF1_49_6]
MKRIGLLFIFILVFTNLGISQSEWEVFENVDKMTDEVDCVVRLISIEGKSAPFKVPLLLIQFDENELILGIVFISLDYNQESVMIRFGKEPAYEEDVWFKKVSYFDVLMFKSSKELVFKSIPQSKLVVKAETSPGKYDTCEFNISGLYEALKKAAKSDPNFKDLLDEYEEYKNNLEEE